MREHVLMVKRSGELFLGVPVGILDEAEEIASMQGWALTMVRDRGWLVHHPKVCGPFWIWMPNETFDEKCEVIGDL